MGQGLARRQDRTARKLQLNTVTAMPLFSLTPPILMVTDIPATHPRVPYFERMISLLASGGITCRLDIDGARYAGKLAMDAVTSGAARMAWVNASHLEAIDPALGVLNLPFFLDDAVLGLTACTDRALHMIDRYTASGGLRTLGMMRGADQLFVSRRELPDNLASMENLRVRVAGPGVYGSIMRALDAVPVAMPIPAIAGALEGVSLDRLFTSPGGWQTQLGMAAPHALRVPGLMLINYVLLVNADWYEALPSETQITLRNVADQCVTHAWRATEKDDNDALAATVQEGARITVAVDASAWRDKLEPLKTCHLTRYPAISAGFLELAVES